MAENAKIMYVEDNPDNRVLIMRVLMAEGYEVVFAENAEQALHYANNEDLDLILMDINLPDVDGNTLTTHMRNIPKLSGIPILALTANVMRGDRERSLEAGCDGYIQKPIDVDELPLQIAAFLVKKR